MTSTFIIAGEQDWVPPHAPRDWACFLPNARLLHLLNSSHFPWIESPEVFFAAEEAFPNGEWPTAALGA